MTRFLDGPAEGVDTLSLANAPRLLRVVRHRGTGEWDAIDEPGDRATTRESIWVYVRVGEPGLRWFLDYTTAGGYRRGDTIIDATYQLLPAQPPDATVRNNAAWERFVQSMSSPTTPSTLPTLQPSLF